MAPKVGAEIADASSDVGHEFESIPWSNGQRNFKMQRAQIHFIEL